LLSSYNISQVKEGDYIFTTGSGIVYSVYLLNDALYFSEFPEFSEEVSTFGFDIISNPSRKTPFDPRVRITISNIILNYLSAQQDKVLFFVCDSADARQRGRMRIFEQWYNFLKVSYIEKYNESILTPEMEIYCSILLHSKNIMRNHIISSFRNLCGSTAEKLKSY
jgi:hypothetical protein